MASLRERVAELADLGSLAMLAEWDQLVMMPAHGGPDRAHQVGALQRLTHDRASAEEIGQWLSELQDAELGAIDRDIVRIARRDFERARRVPGELAAERALAGAEGQEIWQAARAADDFEAFAPALARNIELARSAAEHLAEPGQSRYEALLSDYDYGLRAEDLRTVFAALTERLAPLIERARPASREPLRVPIACQQAAVAGILRRLGVEMESWRVDVSTHPFTVWMGRGDTRITTRYEESGVESLLSSLHEYGHGLYERQVDEALARTNLAGGTSMSIHESQSKLWENHVARSADFAHLMAAELDVAGFRIAPLELHGATVGVEPSLIRVSADPVSYPLHIVLRFELEHALIEGDLEVADLPEAWSAGMRRLLGVEVPSNRLGCLQDVHWSGGSFGYFPSYALGCLIAAALWEGIEGEIGSLRAQLRSGDLAEVQRWLGERIHRHGRRLDTIPLLAQATGRGLDVEPFVRYAERIVGE